ncbi:MAG: hypothetical protein K6G70_02415 [Bacteroidaceae bacterium]|nr:hypothetical protein [Bacteroidaceae bacterium]
MAKVQQKSEKISAFGGMFFVLDKYDRNYLRILGNKEIRALRDAGSGFCCCVGYWMVSQTGSLRALASTIFCLSS